MVKSRQRNIRVFQIENEDENECLEFLKKNAPLLKDYLIFFSYPPSKILMDLCQSIGLCYFCPNESFTHLSDRKPPSSDASKKRTLDIVTKPVRSGEELDSQGDLIICANIHHGARICAGGNLIIFGHCDGYVECWGDFLILRSITSGQVIFSGQIFSSAMIDRINVDPESEKLIIRNGDVITIKTIE